MILIDRESGTKAVRKMVEESRAALARRTLGADLPRRNPAERLRAKIEFKRGIEILYAKLGARVLPVALNSGHFWAPDQPYKRSGIITVDYLDRSSPGSPAPSSRAARRR